MLLAIDTATRMASAALFDASGLVAESTWRSENNHSVELLPTIAALMNQQGTTFGDLSAVAVAQGPGSFTGLRIGMGVAKGLCLALDLPIIAIPTLDIITYAVGDPGCRVDAVIEAGRGRICVASYRYEDGLPVAVSPVSLWKSSVWQVIADEPVLVAGEVAPELVDRLLEQPGSDHIAFSSLAGSVRRAGYLAELAWDRLENDQVDDMDSLAPIYISPEQHQPQKHAAES